MNGSRQQKLIERKRRIADRLRSRNWSDQKQPMLSAGNIQYDLADKTRGLACGGIGAMHAPVRRVGLPEAIDRDLSAAAD